MEFVASSTNLIQLSANSPFLGDITGSEANYQIFQYEGSNSKQLYIEFTECFGQSNIEIYKNLEDINDPKKKLTYKKRTENGKTVLFPHKNRQSGASEHQLFYVKVTPTQLGKVDHKRR